MANLSATLTLRGGEVYEIDEGDFDKIPVLSKFITERYDRLVTVAVCAEKDECRILLVKPSEVAAIAIEGEADDVAAFEERLGAACRRLAVPVEIE